MTSGFSVRGRKVVVMGAARSGVAAAELLQRRGAVVTLSETRASFDDAARLEAMGIQLELGGHQPLEALRGRLGVLKLFDQRGCPAQVAFSLRGAGQRDEKIG